MNTSEDKACETIDQRLGQPGWNVQDANQVNQSTAQGVAIRNFSLEHRHGFVDYLLYIDGEATGVVEAKKKGPHPHRPGNSKRKI